MTWDKKELLKSTVLGVSGLIAFTIIAVIVYLIGMVLDFRSLSSGFISEVILIVEFPLFFILVAVIKILIGGKLIDWITRFFSKIFRIKILVDEKKK